MTIEFKQFPHYVQLEIVSHLDLVDLIHFRVAASKGLQAIAESNVIWLEIARRIGWPVKVGLEGTVARKVIAYIKHLTSDASRKNLSIQEVRVLRIQDLFWSVRDCGLGFLQEIFEAAEVTNAQIAFVEAFIPLRDKLVVWQKIKNGPAFYDPEDSPFSPTQTPEDLEKQSVLIDTYVRIYRDNLARTRTLDLRGLKVKVLPGELLKSLPNLELVYL